MVMSHLLTLAALALQDYPNLCLQEKGMGRLERRTDKESSAYWIRTRIELIAKINIIEILPISSVETKGQCYKNTMGFTAVPTF
jgi:hypothetical protein